MQRKRTFLEVQDLLEKFIPSAKPVGHTLYTCPLSNNLQITEEWYKLFGFHESLPARVQYVIHIAGTKGKGSTATFCERIAREQGLSTVLFTSPHLINVRERIRIQGEPISEDEFCEAFDYIYQGLQNAGQYPAVDSATATKSVFFRFLTMMCLHVATARNTDVLIMETGLGGRLDSTNVLNKVSASGITSIGWDHVEILGSTLEAIASEKAGILRPQVPSGTTYANASNPEIWSAFVRIASEKGASLPRVLNTFVDPSSVTLGMQGAHMNENANLAVGLCRLALTGDISESSNTQLYTYEQRALQEASLAGRSHCVVDAPSSVPIFLDGAHTPESMVVVGNWCAEVLKPYKKVMLLFYCNPPRNPSHLLEVLWSTLEHTHTTKKIHCVSFVQPFSVRDQCLSRISSARDEVLSNLALRSSCIMGDTLPQTEVAHLSLETLENSLKTVSLWGDNVAIVVTGSLYLVGDVLSLLQTRDTTNRHLTC